MKDIFKKKAIDILTGERFDVMAKTYYIKHHAKNTTFPKDMYESHLRVWNGCNEITDPNKNSISDYEREYLRIDESIREIGFNKDFYIPVSNGSILNGAHRLASSLVRKVDVYCKESEPQEGQSICDSHYLKTRESHVPGGLDQVYLDAMAIEYVNYKKNTFVVTLFPGAYSNREEVRKLLKSSCKIIHEKECYIKKYGPFNLVRLFYDLDKYRGNSWLGDWSNNYSGALSKAKKCFVNENPVIFFLIETTGTTRCREIKESIREKCGIGKHSVHINDTREETINLSRYAFNQNSIHFINNCRPVFLENFETFFSQFGECFDKREIENICIDSSAVLSAYGLRDCRDIDFLHSPGQIFTDNPNISCHNEESKHYSETIDDIIYNPKKHFYFKGVKFASLKVVESMKINRNEEKDNRDVLLINDIKDSEWPNAKN